MGATTQADPRQQQGQVQSETPDAKQLRSLMEEVIRETARNQILETDVPAVQEFKMHRAKARLFAESGYFKDEKKGDPIAGAFTKIEIGASMGFTDAQSMMGVSVVGNRPTVEAALRGSKMRELGYGWETQWFEDQQGFTTGVRLWLEKDGKPFMRPKRKPNGETETDAQGKPKLYQVSEKFDLEDAKRIKVESWENGNKVARPLADRDTYKNYPRNMFFARALTNLQRFQVPEALNGVNILSREEGRDLLESEDGLYRPTVNESNGTQEAADEVLAQKISQHKEEEPQGTQSEQGESADSTSANSSEGKDKPNPDGDLFGNKQGAPEGFEPQNKRQGGKGRKGWD